ncbi:lactate oxidase [Pseudomonas sp. BIGb0408]|uniref:Lactate oxidase n=1 Tax=Phytopseudomonas flavescens TaxID=29435 RepID=A0A7Y9XKD4_9GAMM|nr:MULTISPECIES: alpha-hydroxy acid oxidase [Pseudomonas]MCW2292474.1 lactate oxidase [Pseudomonas sp. BIGb0408]NYH72955.1 lactate oxidase [Pseudomonas flavescens]
MPPSRRDTLGMLTGGAALLAAQSALGSEHSPLKESPRRVKDSSTPRQAPKTYNLLELEALASEVIPRPAFDYIARGAGDEQTLRENRTAFSRAFLDQRILTGKTVKSLETKILGSPLRAPVVVSAMAAHGLAHPSAESGTAKGAAAYGTLLGVSTVSTQNLEQVASASNGDKWFQCYLTRDSGFNRELLQRAHAAGYKAIVLTADVTVGGNREQDRRNNLRMPTPGNFLDTSNRPRKIEFAFDSSIGLDSLDFVREHSGGLPLIVKGVTTALDARALLQHGVDAIQVSNHGGRQLDGSPAAFDSLQRVAAEVKGRVPLIFDSGIRRGLDVFKAIAAGADLVAVGRPVLYGLALNGSQGVQWVLEQLEQELRIVMQLSGAATVADIRTTPLLHKPFFDA